MPAHRRGRATAEAAPPQRPRHRRGRATAEAAPPQSAPQTRPRVTMPLPDSRRQGNRSALVIASTANLGLTLSSIASRHAST
jgi:hypothetical protein